jgi:hypothetical protein
MPHCSRRTAFGSTSSEGFQSFGTAAPANGIPRTSMSIGTQADCRMRAACTKADLCEWEEGVGVTASSCSVGVFGQSCLPFLAIGPGTFPARRRGS